MWPFEHGSELSIDALSTFTMTEQMSYNAVITLRVDLKMVNFVLIILSSSCRDNTNEYIDR
jgi:hypothetical protein